MWLSPSLVHYLAIQRSIVLSYSAAAMNTAPCLESNWSKTVFSSCKGTLQTVRQRHSQYLLTGSPIVLKHAILLASCHFPLTFWSNKQCEVLFWLVVTTCDNCDRNHMGQLGKRGHATRIRWIATVLEIFCTTILVALKDKDKTCKWHVLVTHKDLRSLRFRFHVSQSHCGHTKSLELWA